MVVYTEEQYKNAFSEVVEIIQYLPKTELLKIPIEEVEYYISNRNPNYRFEYDYSKSVVNQNISELTRLLLANIYIYYLAENKDELIKAEEYDEYSERDFIQKSNRITNKEENLNVQNELAIIKEENIIKKILRMMHDFLKKLT